MLLPRGCLAQSYENSPFGRQTTYQFAHTGTWFTSVPVCHCRVPRCTRDLNCGIILLPKSSQKTNLFDFNFYYIIFYIACVPKNSVSLPGSTYHFPDKWTAFWISVPKHPPTYIPYTLTPGIPRIRSHSVYQSIPRSREPWPGSPTGCYNFSHLSINNLSGRSIATELSQE